MFFDQHIFQILDLFIICQRKNEKGNPVTVARDQGVQTAIRRLAVYVTILRVDPAVSLVDAFPKRVQAATDVFDLSIEQECVQALCMNIAWISNRKYDVLTITIRVEEFFVKRIFACFQLEQEFTQGSIEAGRVIAHDLLGEFAVFWVGQGFSHGLIVFKRENVLLIPFIKSEGGRNKRQFPVVYVKCKKRLFLGQIQIPGLMDVLNAHHYYYTAR